MKTTPQTKEEVRKEALQLRNGLKSEEREEKSLAICQAVMEDEGFLDARGLHVYLPFGSEVNIQPLISLAWDLGKEVGMMRVQPDGGSQQYLITNQTVYQTGQLGILEPVEAEQFDMESCDLVLVPVVAADENCNRIGYGKGYYDQFLTQHPRPTIGVCFDVQIFPELPVDDLDIMLDKIVTEKRILNCS
ncbi:MAG: 5-formyltetrahydrofolate cyclo-ligase [Candidatus Kapaibacterium sp.]